jgi:hypothetical protein
MYRIKLRHTNAVVADQRTVRYLDTSICSNRLFSHCMSLSTEKAHGFVSHAPEPGPSRFRYRTVHFGLLSSDP